MKDVSGFNHGIFQCILFHWLTHWHLQDAVQSNSAAWQPLDLRRCKACKIVNSISQVQALVRFTLSPTLVGVSG